MLRPWHAVRPLRREVVCSRLHVPSVENERIRFALQHRTAMSTFSGSSQEKHYWDDTKLPPSPHLRPSDAGAPSMQEMDASKLSSSPKHHQTVKEKDAEIFAKLESHSGEGGIAGLELENGKPVGLKRGVRENMFRVI